MICSEHFNEKCYERQHFFRKDFGIPTKKRFVPGSVFSIYPKRIRDEQNEAFSTCPSFPCLCQHRNANTEREKTKGKLNKNKV